MREKTPRQVLSENLRSLMAARSELGTIRKIAEASRSSLSNGKVGRIYAASHTTDIDALQDLADVFGLEPWQLLVDDLNPSALPRLADASMLSEILDAVERRQAAVRRKDQAETPAHQLEGEPRPEEAGALERAIAGRKQKGGNRSKAGGVPQSGTRRRVQGAAPARRKG